MGVSNSLHASQINMVLTIYSNNVCDFILLCDVQADKIATGHNADDIAETVLLNILRGDLPRLSRCAAIITGKS